MATFYVLPPRVCLEEQLAALFGKLLPGLPIPIDSWDAVVERLAECARWPSNAYFIPRDEIPYGQSVNETLAESFGAEPGDRVIEVSASGTRTWTVSGMSATAFAR
jgi:hypothetical protein